MIADRDSMNTVQYRKCHIYIDRQTDTTIVSWWNDANDHVGYQQVESLSWSDGELLRFAMEMIDLVYRHYDQMQHQRMTGRDQR